MQRASDWQRIVRKAWSFRLMLLASVFTTAEAILPLFMDAIPRGLFAMLTLLSVTGGMIARLVAQKDF
jgi:hypothetical protein